MSWNRSPANDIPLCSIIAAKARQPSAANPGASVVGKLLDDLSGMFASPFADLILLNGMGSSWRS